MCTAKNLAQYLLSLLEKTLHGSLIKYVFTFSQFAGYCLKTDAFLAIILEHTSMLMGQFLLQALIFQSYTHLKGSLRIFFTIKLSLKHPHIIDTKLNHSD